MVSIGGDRLIYGCVACIKPHTHTLTYRKKGRSLLYVGLRVDWFNCLLQLRKRIIEYIWINKNGFKVSEQIIKSR